MATTRNAYSVALLLFFYSLAQSQPETDREKVERACQASLTELYVHCSKSGSMAAAIDCGGASSIVNIACYNAANPKLGCYAAQRETQLWCGMPSSGVGTGVSCADAQEKLSRFCYR